MNPGQVLISCEHGGNQIPDAYQYLFSGHQQTVESHRGWDPGALHIAQWLSQQLQAPLFYHTTTRLLIELNRSLHHPALFSEFIHALPEAEKKRLIDDFYAPYRNQVEQHIAGLVENDLNVLHLSVHSFTPIFNGVRRSVDIGLLFDPDRAEELVFCTNWQKKLKTVLPEMRIHFNKPYLGKDDGFTTYLRTKFSSVKYAGIEIEVNQHYIEQPEWEKIQKALSQSLLALL